MAKKRTNVMPIIEDARHPSKYRMLVGMVDVIFSDVAQPDQVCSSCAFYSLHSSWSCKNNPSIRIGDLSIILHVESSVYKRNLFELIWSCFSNLVPFSPQFVSSCWDFSTLWNVVRNIIFLKHIKNECYLLSCQVLLLTNSPAFQIMHMTMHSVFTWCKINTDFLMQNLLS